MAQKILAIDDHPQTLDIVIITLQQNGYQAIGSQSPVQGILIAERERPDLILLDMNMPEMDGKEACRRLRAHPELAHTPIIMFSAEEAEKLAGFEAGADDFLVKPTDPDELIDRIESLLESKGGADADEASEGASAIQRTVLVQSRRSEPTPVEPVESPSINRLIAVVGARGGSGATTLAINLAVSAAESGYLTTLVDLDTLQGHVGLNLNMKVSGGLNSLARLSDHELTRHLPRHLVSYHDNLRLLLTKPNLDGRFPTPSPKQTAIIINALTKTSQCVVVDLGHGMTSTTRAVLDGASQVIICLRPERISLSAAKIFLGQMKEVLFAHSSLHTMLFGTVGGLNLPKKAIEGYLDHPLLAVVPAQPKAMLQAANKGVPFVKLYPRTKLARLFRLLAQHLMTP